MSEREAFVLWHDLPRIKAEREIMDRSARAPIDGEGVYNLILEVTDGDEDAADRARSKFWLSQAKRGEELK